MEALEKLILVIVDKLATRVDGEVEVGEKVCEAKVYRVGELIRVDLTPTKEKG